MRKTGILEVWSTSQTDR